MYRPRQAKMADMKMVEVDATKEHGTALIAVDESVWISVHLRWWDLASALWWFLCPSDKKAWATLTTNEGRRVRTRVIRVAQKHVRIGRVPK